MKRYTLFLTCIRATLYLVFLFPTHTTYGQIVVETINLNNGSTIKGLQAEMPTRDVEYVRDGLLVTYTFNSMYIHPNPESPHSFFLKIKGFGLNSEEGKPSLPMHWDSIVLPTNSNFKMMVVDSSYIEYPIELTASKTSDIISSKEIATNKMKPIKSYKGLFPKQLALLSSSETYKNNTILNVCVCPVQYNYTEKKARLYTKLVYKIQNSKNEKYEEFISGQLALKDPFLNNTTLNYGLLKTNTRENKNAPIEIRKDYLIISISEYADAVNRFANWKRTLGFTTHIEMKNRGQWTVTGVKSIVDMYKENYPDLAYLLIIGDYEDVPARLTSGHVTDYYYCNTANSISAIDNGRIPVATSNEANIVVSKIINYEKEPVQDELFYTNALNCAYFQDRYKPSDSIGSEYAMRRFAQTSEEIRDYLILQGKNVQRVYYSHNNSNPKYWNAGIYSYGEEIPTELQKPIFPWNGNASDIISAINTGTFCVVHNDHGGADVWRDPWFHKNSIADLNNGNKLPVVFSINCETGKFNTPNCFAETFLRKEDGGCVAIFAFTEDSYSGHTDALVLGMFDAIWPEPGLIPSFPNKVPSLTPTPIPTFRLGQILKQGLKRMGETWGRWTLMNELFHCFGDPSMRIYTEKPTEFDNVTISGGTDFISVNLGLESANISFWNQNTNEVVSYEGSTANYNGITDNVVICISAHNKIPYINTFVNNTFYIQNESVGGTKIYQANTIKVGTNVTNTKPIGSVVFNGNKTILIGNEIEINGETTVELGTELEIHTE